MTVALWIAVAVLAVTVVFLVFALSGATRTIADLRWSLHLRDEEEPELEHAEGLAIGATAPAIEGAPRARHLVVFADPGCVACENVVPPLLLTDGLPPVLLVSRSDDGWPENWGSHADVVFDADGQIADDYVVGFTPYAFVVDDGGNIAAHGPADSVEMVGQLVRPTERTASVEPHARRV